MNNLRFPHRILLLFFATFFHIVLNANTIDRKPHPIILNKNFNSILATAPILTATGNQIYCTGSSTKIVTSMSIAHDPAEIGTNAIYIQISSGYINGQDVLSLAGTHSNIIANWDAGSGKLTLKSPTNTTVLYSDFVNAIEDVVYRNNSATPSGTRTFSITVGQANYLPSNGHYYQYVPNFGIAWNTAKTLAETTTYYGLQGYLATITAMDEAILIGEQASGTGWIAGTDEETEGVWKWASGPEIGQIFWNGTVNGSTPNFAFWNRNEPNNTGNNEDYAHITAPGVGIAGSWNDLKITGDTSGNYQPKGYIVEFGGMPGDPVLQISTSTTIYIPKITNTTGNSICGSGSMTLNATASNGIITWYDVPSGGIPLATGSTFNTPNITTTTSYYVDAFNNQCAMADRIQVDAIVNEIPILLSIVPESNCGSGSVLLQATTSVGIIEWFANATGGNALASGSTFNTPIIETTTQFYAEAINNGCVSSIRTPVTATIFKVPKVTDENLQICENGTIRLHAGILSVSYSWPNSEITEYLDITSSGTYTVTMTTADNCSFNKTFNVNEISIPKISNVLVDERKIKINTFNQGNFLYSIDRINYQNSNIFTEVTSGLHTAYVKNNCDISSEDFIVIILPKFFSPNNDSFNDFWSVEGILYYPEAKVSIFDRYGKLITQLSRLNPTWDGTLEGKTLPASDYWYVLKINATLPERKGHFSLVR